MLKYCTRCGLQKNLDAFSRNKNTLDGHQHQCKGCNRAYVQENRDRILARKKQFKKDNPERIYGWHVNYYAKNRDRLLDYHKVYREENRKLLSVKQSAYHLDRLKVDIGYRLMNNLRTRTKMALKNRAKSGSVVRDMGCSGEQLKQHLESKFQSGMTWDNWGSGKGCWNIDHIVPLAAFDLTNRQHFLLACNYLNLQPLWWEDNMKKSATMPSL
jgi:hypothetical protein